MNINSIFKRKHKYLVTFYKPSRVRKYICTRTIGSALQFALKKSFKYGVFTIKRLDKQNMTRIIYVVYTKMAVCLVYHIPAICRTRKKSRISCLANHSSK